MEPDEPTAQDILDALYAAGVDNWEGYDYAMQILRGEHA